MALFLFLLTIVNVFANINYMIIIIYRRERLEVGLVVHCPDHYYETLDLAFSKPIGISKDNKIYYEFSCGTVIILNDNCDVEDRTCEYYEF